MPLEAVIQSRAKLSADDRSAMFALMDRHYENMRRDRFDADLDEKQWVIRLLDADSGRLCGFSTQMMFEQQVPVLDTAAGAGARGDAGPVAAAGAVGATGDVADRGAVKHVRLVFSGDTIVDREHWGGTAMAIAWGRLVFHLIERYSDRPLYWYLISKGFRTYRFLPVYFREFFPRHDAAAPREIGAIIDAVARRKFGTRYDAARGIVRAAPDADRLRAEMGELSESRLSDPHLRFFVERNPGHVDGDELCCLAPLTRENFSPTAERLIRSEAFARQRLQLDDAPRSS